MRIHAYAALAAGLLSIACNRPCLGQEVSYVRSDLGGGHWKYTYAVSNTSPLAINELAITFGRDRYRNLRVATPNPTAGAWSELVVQPDLILQDDGYYDALSLTGGIWPGGMVHGLSVEFDWLGGGQPGAQPFDIVDPLTFASQYSGMTVPEPTSLVLLSLGTLATLRLPTRRS
jgi:hypothetical protein